MPDPAPEMRALALAIRELDAPDALAENALAFLGRAGLLEADARRMASLGPGRLLAYRRLVHRGIGSVCREWAPRTAARLGEERFAAEIALFLHDAGGVASPYYREVPRAFVSWAAPRWREDEGLPPFLADLARYELFYYDVRNDPATDAEPTGLPLDLESPARIAPTALIERFEWAVHELPWSPDDRSEPEPRPVALAFWRREDKTRQLDLERRDAHLLEGLLAGRTLKEALFTACAEVGDEVNAEVLGSIALLLKDLSDRGILFGAEPPA